MVSVKYFVFINELPNDQLSSEKQFNEIVMRHGMCIMGGTGGRGEGDGVWPKLEWDDQLFFEL